MGYIKNLFLSLDPTSPLGRKMPAAKRKAAKKEDKDIQRAAQRAWMLEQKRNMTEVTEEEEPIQEPVVEKKDEVAKDTEADSGVNSEADSGVDETEEAEEDGPLEDWTVKELKDECKTLGLSDKGKKAELIERIRESQAKTAEPVEEAAEETAVEESTPEDAAAEDAPTEEAV